jgi:hypothetical protein
MERYPLMALLLPLGTVWLYMRDVPAATVPVASTIELLRACNIWQWQELVTKQKKQLTLSAIGTGVPLRR